VHNFFISDYLIPYIFNLYRPALLFELRDFSTFYFFCQKSENQKRPERYLPAH